MDVIEPLNRIRRNVSYSPSPGIQNLPKGIFVPGTQVRLRYTVTVLNDTMGTEGIIPTAQVFGKLPNFPTNENNHADQQAIIELVLTPVK